MNRQTHFRFRLMLLAGVLAAIFGFLLFSPEEAVWLAARTAYPILLLTCGLAAAFGLRIWIQILTAIPRIHVDVICITLPALVLAGLFAFRPMGHQVDVDEIAFEGTALQLHLNGRAEQALQGEWDGTNYRTTGAHLNKRSLLFPVLVSLLHRVFGFNGDHGMILNGVLAFLCLPLVWILLREIGGRSGAMAGLLLLVCLPQFVFSARSGGVEILNLFLLLHTTILGVHFARHPDKTAAAALVFSGILLAYTRNESVLFLLPVGILLLIAARQPTGVPFSWVLFLAPFLLLPYAWQLQVFAINPAALDTRVLGPDLSPFSLAHIPSNFVDLVAFLLDPGTRHSNLLPLTVLGILGWAVVLFRRHDPGSSGSPVQGIPTFPLALFAGAILCVVAVHLCYFWSNWTDPLARRYSIAPHLLLVAGVALLFRPAIIPLHRMKPWVVIPLAAAIFQSFTSIRDDDLWNAHVSTRLLNWKRDFLQAGEPEQRIMVLGRNFAYWVARRQSGTPYTVVPDKLQSIERRWSQGMVDAVYLFEWFAPVGDNEVPRYESGFEVPPWFESEPVAALLAPTGHLARLSRVTGIRPSRRSQFENGTRPAGRDP